VTSARGSRSEPGLASTTLPTETLDAFHRSRLRILLQSTTTKPATVHITRCACFEPLTGAPSSNPASRYHQRPARQAQLVQDGRSLTDPVGPESRPRAWNRHPEITYGAILKTARRTITTSQLSRELSSSASSRSEDGFPRCLQSGLRLCTAERRGAGDHRGRSALRAGEKRRGRLVESKEEGIRRG
jgi:hypothetical protein